VKSEIYELGVHNGHVCAFEFVRSQGQTKDIYVVFDGQRIAYRGYSDTLQAKTWVPMVSGYEVVYNDDYTAIEVYLDGKLIH
jgi:hypothetical protein